MQKVIVELLEMKLIGVKTRTLNQVEMNPVTSKIAPLVGQYFADNLAEKIPNRKQPNVVLAGYSNYQSDENGEYDFYFGEAVTSLLNIPAGMEGLIIPAGKYLKITSAAGKRPEIMHNTWRQIWSETKTKQLGGERTYKTDFEIYDERAADPENMIFDIYLGIR